jgi:site-specific recombinase XerD
MRLRQAFREYIALRSRVLRPRTVGNYRDRLEHFAAWLEHQAVTDLQDVTPKHAQAFIDSLRESLKDTSVRQIWTILKVALVWFEHRGATDPQDWSVVLTPKGHSRTPRHLSLEECSDLIRAARRVRRGDRFLSIRDTAMIALILDTGLRTSEALNLRPADLSLVAHRATVQGEIAKSGRERAVYFTAETTGLLRVYMRERDRLYEGAQWFFVAKGGKKMSRTCLYTTIRKIAEYAGLPGVYPHALRHTAGTEYVRAGMDVARLRLLLGHARVETTMIYVHLAEQQDLQPQCQELGVMHRIATRPDDRAVRAEYERVRGVG